MDSPHERHIIRWVRVSVLTLALLVGVWVMERTFVPFGRYAVRYEPGTPSRAFHDVAAKERYRLLGTANRVDPGERFLLLTVDPLSFRVDVPRPFTDATVKIRYDNPDALPIVRLGVRQSSGGYYFETIGRFQRTLEQLSEKRDALDDQSVGFDPTTVTDPSGSTFTWTRRMVDGMTVWNRYMPEQGSNVLDPLPDSSSSVVFDVDLTPHYRLDGYTASPDETAIPHTLRGSHSFFTYIREEPLTVSAVRTEMNLESGADPVELTVWHGAALVGQQRFDDDGDDLASQVTTAPQDLTYTLGGLEEGLYEIRLSTTTDVLMTSLTSAQHLFVARGSVWVHDITNGHATLLTDSDELTVTAVDERSLQTVDINGAQVVLQDVGESETVETDQSETTLSFSGASGKASGNGSFAFDANNYFDAGAGIFPTLTEETDLAGINTIVARWEPTVTDGEWTVGEANFRAPILYTNDKGDVEFLMQAQGLGEDGATLRLRSIDVEFTKPPLTLRRIIDAIF